MAMVADDDGGYEDGGSDVDSMEALDEVDAIPATATAPPPVTFAVALQPPTQITTTTATLANHGAGRGPVRKL